MPKKYKPRARNLSDSDIDTIVMMLDGWVGELTWYTLIDAIKVWQKISIGYTRQALHNRERIHSAYLCNKKRLSEAEMARKKELKKLIRAEALDLLKAEHARLKTENECFLRQFVTSVSKSMAA